jgi:hypothetical protein
VSLTPKERDELLAELGRLEALVRAVRTDLGGDDDERPVYLYSAAAYAARMANKARVIAARLKARTRVEP